MGNALVWGGDKVTRTEKRKRAVVDEVLVKSCDVQGCESKKESDRYACIALSTQDYEWHQHPAADGSDFLDICPNCWKTRVLPFIQGLAAMA